MTPLVLSVLMGCRSCLLHRFIRDEWKALSSHTIGVEFANKIIKVGSGTRRKRMKLQVSKIRRDGVDGSCGIQLDRNDFGV